MNLDRRLKALEQHIKPPAEPLPGLDQFYNQPEKRDAMMAPMYAGLPGISAEEAERVYREIMQCAPPHYAA